MTQEQIIRNCENLLEGNSQDPLYQMHGNQFSCKTEQSLEGFIRH